MADELQPLEEVQAEPVISNKDKALWMPEGSVRAIITLIIVITGCVLIYTEFVVPDWFIVAFTNAVSSYFSYKSILPFKSKK